ncbi:MAG: pyruvate kinase [Candidatus Nanohaloarchaeota archaeon QJJ-5]|nr:pyruvate kinase [Candidatus Nanohaloarchaeota archaeon QJJ-5]
MTQTKIVATIGPASDDTTTLTELADAGIDVARQNLSHGDHEEHRQIKKRIRNLDTNIAVMLDTQGPEIRLNDVEDNTEIKTGEQVELSTADHPGTSDELTVDYDGLLDHLDEGDTVLIDDGKIELEVRSIQDSAATCAVTFGGKIYPRKSVNVPGKDLGLQAPTEKDKEDIAFAAEEGFDFVAASFVKEAQDIHDIRAILDDHDAAIDIIAKIEHITAVENLESIIEAADGIMVARGDLGIELPASDVPMLQKKIIKKCNAAGKPVITATQMLKSMTENPRATRAEVSDVANAVLDGTDAVMLSEETAIGEYPKESVELMDEIARSVETSRDDDVHHTVKAKSTDVADVICKNIWQAARETDAAYIVAHTTSGYTARQIAKYRPDTDIIAFTDKKRTQRQLALVWGVTAYHEAFDETVDQMLRDTTERLYTEEIVNDEDTLVLSAGVPTSVPGTTNMMEIRTVESIIDD